MHRLGAGPLAGVEDLVDDEVAVCGRGRPNQHGLVGHFDVQRVPIGFGIDGDGFNTQAPRSLDDAAGDLAAIGDQNSLEHAAMDPASPAFRLCCGAAEMSTAAPGSRTGQMTFRR
jgi:hypothetical protein